MKGLFPFPGRAFDHYVAIPLVRLFKWGYHDKNFNNLEFFLECN